jgi:hypothetical protein
MRLHIAYKMETLETNSGEETKAELQLQGHDDVGAGSSEPEENISRIPS